MAYGSFIVGGGGTIPRIGDVIVTTVKTSPATRYKNTVWELVAQNRVPMGAGDGHEGGETVEAGLPNITGQATGLYGEIGEAGMSGALLYYSGRSKGTNTGWESGRQLRFDASVSNSIYGASDTVQPPAYYFYFWRRVS